MMSWISADFSVRLPKSHMKRLSPLKCFGPPNSLWFYTCSGYTIKQQ